MPAYEKKQLAQVYVTHLYCKTDKVAMTYTERTLPTQPPKFEYQCPICKFKEISAVRYPHITYHEQDGQ
jgi:hypothetical protein